MNLEFSITVLGPPRSGKTTLLSSIFKQFNQVVDDSTDLEIKPNDAEISLLNEQINNLKSAFSSVTQLPLNNADVLHATELVEQDEDAFEEFNKHKTGIHIRFFDKLVKDDDGKDIKYRFNLGEKKHKPKIQLILRDYPGEQLEDDPGEVIGRVRDCCVTMVTIDTPLVMTEAGHSSDDQKKSDDYVTSIFRESYKDLSEKKLVILAPIKCEKWMVNAELSRQLADRVTERYKSLLDLLASEDLHDKVAVVITPVETLGGVMYAYMDDKSIYSPKFIKKSISATYDPRYCDQPLRYALRFILKRFLENSGFWFHLFGYDKPYENAIDDFTKECLGDSLMESHVNGFVVVQGNKLL